MGVVTLFDRQMPGVGVAETPFRGRLVPRRLVEVVEEESYVVPKGSVRIGRQIHPDSGDFMGEAYLPLSSKQGVNEAINVFGPSQTGKSIVIRRLIEHFSLKEHRCVIVIDPTKNQYWSVAYPQSRGDLLQGLRAAGEGPQAIPEVQVYVPIYDEPSVSWGVMQRDWHATRLLSMKTSGLTASGFFELGDIDPSGRMYQNYLEMILGVPKSQRTVNYILGELHGLAQDKTKARSISSVINIFEPLTRQGIIRDDGTDLMEMLHPPRKRQPGKVSVISLGTGALTDRRRDALVSSVCQQLYEYTRDDSSLRPVLVVDEAWEFIPRKESDHKATYKIFSKVHLQTRAWGVTRIYGFQYPETVAEFLVKEGSTPWNISMTKSMMLTSGRVLNDTGLGHVMWHGTGDPDIPDMDILVKFYPCRTKHVD